MIFFGITNYVIAIFDQLKQEVTNFGVLKTYVAKCSDYHKLAKFPGPIQSLILDHLKAARKVTEEGMY